MGASRTFGSAGRWEVGAVRVRAFLPRQQRTQFWFKRKDLNWNELKSQLGTMEDSFCGFSLRLFDHAFHAILFNRSPLCPCELHTSHLGAGQGKHLGPASLYTQTPLSRPPPRRPNPRPPKQHTLVATRRLRRSIPTALSHVWRFGPQRDAPHPAVVRAWRRQPRPSRGGHPPGLAAEAVLQDST